MTEAVTADESRATARRLVVAGAEVTAHFYRGTHSPVYWRREPRHALPMLLDALGGVPGARQR